MNYSLHWKYYFVMINEAFWPICVSSISDDSFQYKTTWMKFFMIEVNKFKSLGYIMQHTLGKTAPPPQKFNASSTYLKLFVFVSRFALFCLNFKSTLKASGVCLRRAQGKCSLMVLRRQAFDV